jgi:hypothetical protein
MTIAVMVHQLANQFYACNIPEQIHLTIICDTHKAFTTTECYTVQVGSWLPLFLCNVSVPCLRDKLFDPQRWTDILS